MKTMEPYTMLLIIRLVEEFSEWFPTRLRLYVLTKNASCRWNSAVQGFY
jgi:hypothetical protein